jgi:hypothetical protein
MGPPVMMPPSAPQTAPAPVPVVVDTKKGNG